MQGLAVPAEQGDRGRAPPRDASASDAHARELESWDVEAWEALAALPPAALVRMERLAEPHVQAEQLAPWLASLARRRSLGAVLALLSSVDSALLMRHVGFARARETRTTLPATWAPLLGERFDSQRSPAVRAAVCDEGLELDGVLHAVVAADSALSLLVPLAGSRLARLDLRTSGVTLLPARDMGLRAAGLHSVELSSVRVARADVAHVDPTFAAQVWMQRRLHASEALRVWCRELLATTFAFIGQRPFQGGVLAAMQVVRHRIADLDAQYRTLAALVRRAAQPDLEQSQRVLLLAEHLHQSVGELVEACQQLHGGRGFLSEQWVSRAYRDARGLGRLLGSHDDVRVELAAQLASVVHASQPPAALLAPSDDLARGRFRARARAHIAGHMASRAPCSEPAKEEIIALHRSLARLQLTTAALPVSDGGLGADFGHTVTLIEELMTGGSASVAVSLMLAAGTVFPLLAQHASAPLKRRLLPPIAAGESIFAFGITEPDGGSDLVNAMRTRARADGDHWVVDGTKMFLTNGPIADHVLTLVRTGDAEGPLQASLLVIAVDTPGVLVSPGYDKLGLRGSPTGSIEFRGVRVPRENLIGRVGLGVHLLAHATVLERVLIAAGSVALAIESVRSVLAACNERSAASEVLRLAALSRVLARLAGQQALVEQVVAKICGGELDRADAALLKFSACEAAQAAIECAADALDDDAEPLLAERVQQSLRDCRIFSVFAGASEMMRDVYSASLLPSIRLGAWGADV